MRLTFTTSHMGLANKLAALVSWYAHSRTTSVRRYSC